MTDQSAAPQQPQPVAPQSNDEAISQYARGLLDEIVSEDVPTDALDPNPREAPQATEEQTEQEAETPTPEPEVPMVEVDVDGEKYLVPEKVKHRVMADKDYRQKTMEVSATKKGFEALTATAQKVVEQAQHMAPYHAELFQMDSRIQQLGQALQSGQLNHDPVEFNRVQGEVGILLHARDRLASGLAQHQQQLTVQQQQLRAQQWSLEAPKLFEQFPELSKPENAQKLVKYVADEGLPQEVLEYMNYSAPAAKLAWKAHQYDLMVKDQKAATAKLNEKVKTLPSASQSSRAADGGAKDKQLRSEWKKGGGKINDPAFDQLLRSKLRG